MTGDRHALSVMLESCIEDLFDELDMDIGNYSVTHSQIRGICPVHTGADCKQAFTYYFNKGLWFCWTRRCEVEKGSDLIGLIATVLDCKINKACKWAQKFLRGRNIVDNQTAIRIKNIQREREEEEEFDWWGDHVKQKVFNPSSLKMFKPYDSYFEDRKLDPEVALKIGVGRPPKTWLKNVFSDKEVVNILRYMRKRLVFPVKNVSGGIVGFTGRSLTNKPPKWIHFPTKSRFKTSINLFNLHSAAKWIRKTRSVVITEGPFDVMKLIMAGYYNCVAVFGLQVTDAHVALLQHCGLKNAILGFDPDRVESGKVADNISRLESKDLTVRVLRWEGKEDIGDMKVKKLRRVMAEHLSDLPNFKRWRQR